MKFIDIAGQKYNRLTVLKQAGRDKRGYVIWLCKCDCGNETNASANSLRQNNTQSCGCWKREELSTQPHAQRHGRTFTPEYRAWNGLRERCRNPNNKDFANYGGRGIRVCERWQVFEAFLTDMGERPPGMVAIDRINNDGDYEPGNCRWATASQQNKNRRPLNRNEQGRFACV